ncbi:MAG: hypothetical protein IJ789_03605 [Bacteroidales bacterium]|nr:hypothetical protein [Bacteroidales bacterium]
MFKKVFLLSLSVVMAFGLKAQTIMESTAKIGELTVPAFVMSVDKDVKLTQDAMRQRLKDTKLKVKNEEGYVAILDQVVPEIAPTPIKFYTKVEEMGKRKDKTTMVTVSAYSNDMTIDQMTMQVNVRSFLQEFATYVNKYEAQQNMLNEEGNLKKAQKDAATAASNLDKIDKSIAADQQKIADKKAEIEKYKQKIKDCEKEIKDLEASIEKSNGKRVDAQQKVDKAGESVRQIEGEVDKYRQQAQ